jgi:hypothetical protein
MTGFKVNCYIVHFEITLQLSLEALFSDLNVNPYIDIRMRVRARVRACARVGARRDGGRERNGISFKSSAAAR